MKTTLSIIIPVYNEQSRLKGCFAALTSWKAPKTVEVSQIIFVNDGSTDGTLKKLQAAKAKIQKALGTPVTILSYAKNQGKGFAVKTGVLSATADYILVADADMSTNFSQLHKLLPSMKKGADVIVGTRKNGHSTVTNHQPLYRELLGRGFTLLAQTILNTSITDFTCGFKVYKRTPAQELFSRMHTHDWGYDAETLFLAKKFGLSIKEIPVVWSDMRGSKVRLMRDIPKSLVNLLAIRSRDLMNAYALPGKPILAKTI